MAQPPQVAPVGGMQGFASQNSAVPDSNTLLAYKLLQDSRKDSTIFEDMLKEEMKYLVTGIALLQNDPYLQMKMGGVTLNNAGVLANTLKSKVSELDIRERIEPTAQKLLKHEYGKPTLKELRPGRRQAISVTYGDKDTNAQLKVLAGKWAGTGINIPGGDDAARKPFKIDGTQEP